MASLKTRGDHHISLEPWNSVHGNGARPQDIFPHSNYQVPRRSTFRRRMIFPHAFDCFSCSAVSQNRLLLA